MKLTNSLKVHLVPVIVISDWAIPWACIIRMISVPEIATVANWTLPTWSFVSKPSTSWPWRWIYKEGDGIQYQYQLIPTCIWWKHKHYHDTVMLLSHFQRKMGLKSCISFNSKTTTTNTNVCTIILSPCLSAAKRWLTHPKNTIFNRPVAIHWCIAMHWYMQFVSSHFMIQIELH